MGRSTCGCCEDTITTKCFKENFLWNGSFGEDTHCVGPTYVSGTLNGFLVVGMNIAGSRDYGSTFISYRTFGGFSGDVEPLREANVSTYFDSKIRYATQKTLVFSKDLSSLSIGGSGAMDRLGEPRHSTDSGTQYYLFENRDESDLYKKAFVITSDTEFSGITYVSNIDNIASFNASGDTSYKNNEIPADRISFYEETSQDKFHLRLSIPKDSDRNYGVNFLAGLAGVSSSGDFCIFDKGGNVTYRGPEGVLDREAIASCFGVDDKLFFCDGNSIYKFYQSGIQPIGYINNIKSTTYNHVNSGIVSVIGDEYPLPVNVKTNDSGSYSIVDYHETSQEFSGLPKYEWNIDYSNVIDFYREKYNRIADVSSGLAYTEWQNGVLSFQILTPNKLSFTVNKNSHVANYSGDAGMFNDPVLTIHSGFIPRNSTNVDVTSNSLFSLSLHRSGIFDHTPYNSFAVFDTDLNLVKYNYIPYSGIVREYYITKTPDSGIQPTYDNRFTTPTRIINFVEYEENVSGALEFYNRNLDKPYIDEIPNSGSFITIDLDSNYLYNRQTLNNKKIWLDNITNEDTSFFGETTSFTGTSKEINVYRDELSLIDEITNLRIEENLRFWKDVSNQSLRISSIICENDKTYVTIAVNTPVEYWQYQNSFGINIENSGDVLGGIPTKRYSVASNPQFPSGYAAELCSTLGIPYDESYVGYTYGTDAQKGIVRISNLVENNGYLNAVQYEDISTGNSYDVFYHSEIRGRVPGAILTRSSHPNGEEKVTAEGTCMDLSVGPNQVTINANYVDIVNQVVTLETADFDAEFDVDDAGYDIIKFLLSGTSAPDFGSATMGVFTRDDITGVVYFYGMGTANPPFEVGPGSQIREGVVDDSVIFNTHIYYGKYLQDLDWTPIIIGSPYYTSNNIGGSVYEDGEKTGTVNVLLNSQTSDFPLVRFNYTGDISPTFLAPAGGGKLGTQTTYWDNGFFGVGNIEILRSIVLPKQWSASGPADNYDIDITDPTPVWQYSVSVVGELKRQALLGSVNYQYQYGPFDIETYIDIIYNIFENELTDYLSEPTKVTQVRDNYPFLRITESDKVAFPTISFQEILVNTLPLYELYLATYDSNYNLISIENYDDKYGINLVDYSEPDDVGIDRFKISSQESGNSIIESYEYVLPHTTRTIPNGSISNLPDLTPVSRYSTSYSIQSEKSGNIRPYWNKSFRIGESQSEYYSNLESKSKYISDRAAFVDMSFIPAFSFNRGYDSEFNGEWYKYQENSSGLRLKTDNFHDKFYIYEDNKKRYLENFPNDVDSGNFAVSCQLSEGIQRLHLNYTDYDNLITSVVTGRYGFRLLTTYFAGPPISDDRMVPTHAEFSTYMLLNGPSGINDFNVDLHYSVNKSTSRIYRSGESIPTVFYNDGYLYVASTRTDEFARIPYENGLLGSGVYPSQSGILASDFYDKNIEYTYKSYTSASGRFELTQQGINDMIDYFNQNISGVTYVEGSGEFHDFGKIAINIGYNYYQDNVNRSYSTYPFSESLNSFEFGKIYFDFRTEESGFKIDRYRDVVKFTDSGTVDSYDLNNVHYSTYSSGNDRDIYTQFGALTRTKSKPLSLTARDGFLCTTGNIISDNRLKPNSTREEEESQIISAIKDLRVKDDVVPH